MNAIFNAYDLPVDRLVEFYRRLNQTITFPDGMTTSLGVVYWGRDEHLAEIERAIARLIDAGAARLKLVLQAIRTPARLTRFAEQTGISPAILRILKHDIELWLPQAVALERFEWFKDRLGCLSACSRVGWTDQLEVISGGQTPEQRARIARETALGMATTDEIVKLCDYYRTGKNLEHIRAKIYYDMGMDMLEKWAGQTSEAIIARFTEYIEENGLEGERLIPWPKEVRNGIEWARLHQEVYAVEW